MNILIIYLIVLGIVVTDAWGDANRDKNGTRDHILEMSTILLHFVLLFLYKYLGVHYFLIISLYFFIRIYAFNYTYNSVRGLPGLFRGETDEIFDKWAGKLSTSVYSTLLLIALFLSVVACFVF